MTSDILPPTAIDPLSTGSADTPMACAPSVETPAMTDTQAPAAGSRHKHRKGGSYTVLGVAKVQTDAPLSDYDEVVVYQSEADRLMWARPVEEFTDGRFTHAPAAPAPTGDMVLVPRDLASQADRLVAEAAFSDEDTQSAFDWIDEATPILRTLATAPSERPELPTGAIVNGRILLDRLEQHYEFRDQHQHPLHGCGEWQDMRRCFEAIAEHALAAAPSPSASTMGVKELVWAIASNSDYGDPLFAQAWVAAGLKGFYRLERRMDGQFTVWFPLEGFGQMFASEAKAKAVAQADFTRRIQSCLSSAGGEGTVEALRKIVERIEWGNQIRGGAGYLTEALEEAKAALHGASLSPPKTETETDTITDATVADIMAGIEVPAETASERERLVEAHRLLVEVEGETPDDSYEREGNGVGVFMTWQTIDAIRAALSTGASR